MSDPEAAFADLAKPTWGKCFRCRRSTEVSERVMVRITAQRNQGSKGLGSLGRTMCPECARATYDALGGLLVNGE